LEAQGTFSRRYILPGKNYIGYRKGRRERAARSGVTPSAFGLQRADIRAANRAGKVAWFRRSRTKVTVGQRLIAVERPIK
jgi:hypothetical protein